MTGPTVPEFDRETGELLPQVRPERTPPAALRSHIQPRHAMPKLDSPEAVDAEIQRELYKLELLGQRLTELRLMKHGYYDGEGTYVPGADFEYAEKFDERVRVLYYDCNDMSKPKDERPKWPGEDVRESIVNKDIPKEKREHKAALDGELKSLTEYRMITSDRLSGLQSLLGYRKEEAKAAAQAG